MEDTELYGYEVKWRAASRFEVGSPFVGITNWVTHPLKCLIALPSTQTWKLRIGLLHRAVGSVPKSRYPESDVVEATSQHGRKVPVTPQQSGLIERLKVVRPQHRFERLL